MADKTTGELDAVKESPIGGLPQIMDLYDDTKIPVEQQGQAMHMTGKQWADYARESVKQYVQVAENAADSAKENADKSALSAKAAADSAAAAKASQTAAAASEKNAGASEQAAAASADAAKASENAAASSEKNAKASEQAASSSEAAARASEQAAANSAADSDKSAETAKQYSGNPAIPNPDTGNWMIWNAETQKYEETDLQALLVDKNRGTLVQMWFGTIQEYNDLPKIDPDIYYNILEGEP